jgi:hypothetical protein
MKKTILFFSATLLLVSFTSCTADDLNSNQNSSQEFNNSNQSNNDGTVLYSTTEGTSTDPIIIIKKD